MYIHISLLLCGLPIGSLSRNHETTHQTCRRPKIIDKVIRNESIDIGEEQYSTIRSQLIDQEGSRVLL